MTRPKILITGAAFRLGKAIAQAFFARGCDLLLHYNQSASQAEALRDVFNQQRANSCHIIQANLNNNHDLPKLIEQSLAVYAGLDHLINNASIFYPKDFLNTDNKIVDEFMQVNFFAPLKLIQLAHTHLAENSGSVVNLVDIYAQSGLAQHTAYVSAKAALLGASQQLAGEYTKIRINCVSPGAILWPAANSNQQLSSQKQQAILQNTAVKRLGRAENIAATVCYLALDASYTTGSQIKVDGGRSLYI